MRVLPCSIYTGGAFDDNTCVIIPKTSENLNAILAFIAHEQFHALVRKIDQTVKVTYPTLVKVPFDLARWQAVAAERFPSGLPEPYSDDPTQWLFHGHPAFAMSGTEL